MGYCRQDNHPEAQKERGSQLRALRKQAQILLGLLLHYAKYSDGKVQHRRDSMLCMGTVGLAVAFDYGVVATAKTVGRQVAGDERGHFLLTMALMAMAFSSPALAVEGHSGLRATDSPLQRNPTSVQLPADPLLAGYHKRLTQSGSLQHIVP